MDGTLQSHAMRVGSIHNKGHQIKNLNQQTMGPTKANSAHGTISMIEKWIISSLVEKKPTYADFLTEGSLSYILFLCA